MLTCVRHLNTYRVRALQKRVSPEGSGSCSEVLHLHLQKVYFQTFENQFDGTAHVHGAIYYRLRQLQLSMLDNANSRRLRHQCDRQIVDDSMRHLCWHTRILMNPGTH